MENLIETFNESKYYLGMNKLRKNHKFLSIGGHIKQICHPLQHLHTHMFTYMKNFHDGTQINISSESQWVEDYYALKLHDSSYFESEPGQYESGFKWWPEASDLPVFTHGRDYYNSHQGITLCQQVEDGCEFYFFSGGRENPAMLDLYLNNLDLLEKFAGYFKKEAKPLLEQCEQHRIIRCSEDKIMLSSTDNIQRDIFLQSIGHENDVPLLRQYEQLTQRENECLQHLLKEASTASIATAMKISTRTVETHIDHIKTKFNCRTRQELIIKILQKSQ